MSRFGKSEPSAKEKGTVNAMDRVTAPFGPASVVTSASRTVPFASLPLRANASMPSTHTKRTPSTSSVMSSTSPTRFNASAGPFHVGMMARGSCMPSSTNTTPLITNTSVSHTLSEASLRRADAGVDSFGSSVMSRPAATTARMPLTPTCSATRNTRNGVNTSNTTCTVTLSKPCLRMRRRATAATRPSARPSRMPPKKLTANVDAASVSENAPVTAAAMANWNDTTPDASLMRASPESSVF